MTLPQEYTREVLHRDENYELVLIVWPPGSRSRKHDHGDSWGLVRVLAGTVWEERDGKRLQHEKGAVVVEAPGTVHAMGNESGQEARTLHYYTPKLTMKYYD